MNEILQNISKNDIEKFILLKKLFQSNEQPSLRKLSLKEFLDENLEYAKHNLSAHTSRLFKTISNLMLGYISPGRQIDSITVSDAEKFLRHLRKTAPAGVYAYFRTLKAMFNRGKEWNYFSHNPFDKIKLPKIQQDTPEFLTPAEFQLFLSKVSNQNLKNIYVVLFYTGMRVSELLNLQWKDVDLNNRTIKVGSRDNKTKNRKSRLIPMNEPTNKMLMELYDEKKSERLIFCKIDGSPFTPDYISKRFKQAIRSAGLQESLHLHSLRASFASNLARAGVHIVTIQELLGHVNLSTVRKYAQIRLEDKIAAVNKLNDK